MPRQPRLDAPATLHHVLGRGIEAILIFSVDGFVNRHPLKRSFKNERN